ncbi:hypothetical protein [Anaerosolibacter sp.]|uniref:hypothetical protein n=1 Tax=Anaerosolibacter sp. TaxID=1872527 RepID=UPI0039EF57D7
MIRNFFGSIKDYLYDLTLGRLALEMKQELMAYIKDLDELLVIGLMIGFFVIMSGNRRAGTKITSFSLLVYFITKVVLIAYVY